ncbi:MAG: hypothetical protein PHN56_00285 [Candidatus Nanoarchaeia archaeon]|nr:hypothetical protein [Candidatus Nanoarchaeia archaeon]
MAKKVFNKRIRRKNRVTERRRLKSITKKSIQDKIKKSLDSQNKDAKSDK